MNVKAKEGQVIISGRVGTIDPKTDTLTSLSIANRVNKDETEWIHVALTDGEKQKLATLANTYLEVGQYVTILANEVEKGEYKNLYAVFVELGPKSQKSQSA